MSDELNEWGETLEYEAGPNIDKLYKSIIQENRHSSYDGKWFGPDPEPRRASAMCNCPGCHARFHGK